MESFRLRKQFEYSLERIFDGNRSLMQQSVVDVKSRCFQQFSAACPTDIITYNSDNKKSVQVKNIFCSPSFLIHIVSKTVTLIDTQNTIKIYHPAYPLILALRTCIFKHLNFSSACAAIVEFIKAHSSAISRFCIGLFDQDGSFPEIRTLIWQHLLTLKAHELQKYFPWIRPHALSVANGHTWGLLLPRYGEASADDLSKTYANSINTHNPIIMSIAEYDIRMVDAYLARKQTMRCIS